MVPKGTQQACGGSASPRTRATRGKGNLLASSRLASLAGSLLEKLKLFQKLAGVSKMLLCTDSVHPRA